MLVLEKNSQILQNPKTFQLVIDGEKVQIMVTRIKTLTSVYLNLLKVKELFHYEGFFIHKGHTFTTSFFKQNVDLLFVDKDGFIIAYYQNMKPNKITKTHKETLFLYVLPQNFLRILKLELEKTTQIKHIKVSAKKAKVSDFSKIKE